MNEWESFEHRQRNLWPQNPTQTAYKRFAPTKFQLQPTRFDRALKDFDKGLVDVLRTPYLKVLEKNDGRNRYE